MTSQEAAMLDRLAAQACSAPCEVARCDMMQLLALAQMGPQTSLWHEVSVSSDPVVIMPNLVLMMIGWARGCPDHPGEV
jgi:hypothetical protein